MFSCAWKSCANNRRMWSSIYAMSARVICPALTSAVLIFSVISLLTGSEIRSPYSSRVHGASAGRWTISSVVFLIKTRTFWALRGTRISSTRPYRLSVWVQWSYSGFWTLLKERGLNFFKCDEMTSSTVCFRQNLLIFLKSIFQCSTCLRRRFVQTI